MTPEEKSAVEKDTQAARALAERVIHSSIPLAALDALSKLHPVALAVEVMRLAHATYNLFENEEARRMAAYAGSSVARDVLLALEDAGCGRPGTSNTWLAMTREIIARAERADARPDDLRAKGWTVAVHNDYRLNGEAHTFWLLTNGSRAVKGEGRTDAEALNQIRAQIKRTMTCPECGGPAKLAGFGTMEAEARAREGRCGCGREGDGNPCTVCAREA